MQCYEVMKHFYDLILEVAHVRARKATVRICLKPDRHGAPCQVPLLPCSWQR